MKISESCILSIQFYVGSKYCVINTVSPLNTKLFSFAVSFIPIIRELVGLGTSIVALTLATSLALITIALGWIRYRPLLAMAILAGAAIPIYMSRKKAEKDKGHEETKGFY